MASVTLDSMSRFMLPRVNPTMTEAMEWLVTNQHAHSHVPLHAMLIHFRVRVNPKGLTLSPEMN